MPSNATPPMVARADLFGDPVRSAGQLSPRGDKVAFLAPRDGVGNIWVLSVDAMDDARPITAADRSVGAPVWAYDNTTILYLADEDLAPGGQLLAVSADGGESRALTPAGMGAEIVGLSAEDPGGAMVTLRQPDRAWPDLYRIDLASGRRTLVYRNDNRRGVSQFLFDAGNRLRLGVRAEADGDAELVVREPGERWRTLFSIPFQDTLSSRPLSIESDARSFLMLDSSGRDRAALVRVDIDTGVKTVLGESARADVADVWLDPATRAPEAYVAEYLRREWRALDADAETDLEFLNRQLSGDFEVTSRSADDARWIVVEQGPTLAPRSYLYDRGESRRITLLFRHYPSLEQAPLQPMTPVEIAARDGLTLVSYLTLPIGSDADGDGRPETPAPLVLLAHDGPWARDSYGYNPLHQWLANRGYATLSVNFRGSTGFGTAFLNAGNAAWGGRMQEDLIDAAHWAVSNGVAEPGRLAVAGAGFGGYSALIGASHSPGEFRCAASFGAITNLTAYIEAAPRRGELTRRIGDPSAGEGRLALRDQSPVMRAAQIGAPVLMALGGRDPRASRGDADQIAQTLHARRIGVTYLYFPDEGGTLLQPTDRAAFFAVLEHFFGDCLSGRVEPVGTAFEGASMQALQGAVNVPGLNAFARRTAPRPQHAPEVSTNAAPAVAPAEPAPTRTGPPS
ncbi:MAG: prolyl oligopeptidase family serine peptidase [Terricaulis sp.]